MKRYIYGLAILSGSILLFACGDSSQSNTSRTSRPTNQSEFAAGSHEPVEMGAAYSGNWDSGCGDENLTFTIDVSNGEAILNVYDASGEHDFGSLQTINRDGTFMWEDIGDGFGSSASGRFTPFGVTGEFDESCEGTHYVKGKFAGISGN